MTQARQPSLPGHPDNPLLKVDFRRIGHVPPELPYPALVLVAQVKPPLVTVGKATV